MFSIGHNGLLSGAFLGRTAKYEGRTRQVSDETALALQSLSRNLVNTNNPTNIALTTGLGLSDKGVPLRLPALLIPALQMLRELKSYNEARGFKQISARYIIYQASDFIAQMNKLDPELAKTNSEICKNYIKAFVHQYFPDVSSQIDLFIGDDVSMDYDAVQKLAGLLKNDLPEEIKDDMQKILNYGGRRNAIQDSSYYYAAANIILNGGYNPCYPLSGTLPKNTAIVMPMGGKKEIPFFAMSRFYAQSTNVNYQVIPLVIPVGSIPAYYPFSKGDVLVGAVEEEIEKFNPNSQIAGDFALLAQYGISAEDLSGIANNVETKSYGQNNRSFGRNGPTS